MKRKLFKRNSFLQKMLLSIVGLICIPMICIQLYMIVNANEEFQQENTAYYQRAMQSLALSFDKQLSSISATAYRMQMDSEVLRPLTEDVRGYDAQVVSKKIGSYGLDSPLINFIGVYYAEKDMVLQNNSKYTLQNACNQFFPAGTQGNADLQALLKNGDATGFLYTGTYDEAAKKQLIITKSITPSGRDSSPAVAYFVLNDAQFERWCDIFVPNAKSFAVFDKEENQLLGGSKVFPEIMDDREFRDFLSDYEPSHIPATSTDMIIYKYQELETGYTYMACVSKDTVEAALNHYATQAAGTIVVTVILSAILLSVTLYINYMPVHRIVKRHIGIDSRTSMVSELELLNTHLFAQDERITSQNQLLESFIVGDLLSGIGADAAYIERHFDPEIYHSFAAALSFAPMTTVQSSDVCKKFSGEADGKLVFTTVPYRTEMVFVYASEKSINPEKFQKVLGDAVCAVIGQLPEIRMGTVVESILDIQSSYNSALPTNRFFSDTEDTQLEGYPQTLVTDFAAHVGSGEWDRVLADLDGLERVNKDMKPSLKRFVHLKVLNFFLSNLPKSGHTLSGVETNQLLSYTNGQHLYNMIRRCVLGFQNTQKTVGEENAVELRKKLLDYVNSNFCSSEMCLSSAADYLQTSIYTVSRIFKETTGSGFKEYITEKRLQHACSLLRKSNMPISEIGAACGFDNADYFTVIFRNKYGMAPSKYRKEAETQIPSDTE